MRNKLVLMGGLILLAVVITLLGFNILQQKLLPPLIYAWSQVQFVATIIWRSQDQFLLWYIFLYIGLLLAVHTVIKIHQPGKERKREPATYPGPVSEWTQRLETIQEGMYYRWRLAQRIRRVAENVLSSRTGLSPQQVRQRIKSGDVDLDPAFLNYLQATYRADIQQYFSTHREDEEHDPIRALSADQILTMMERFMNRPGGTP